MLLGAGPSAGALVEGTVGNLAKFGAFVELAEGVEGRIHIGDLSAEKRLNHPEEVLKPGEKVRALVLEVADGVFGTWRLSSKQQGRVEAAVEEGRPELASMTALLGARWKQGEATVAEPARAGQLRSFRVAALDAAAKRIGIELLG